MGKTQRKILEQKYDDKVLKVLKRNEYISSTELADIVKMNYTRTLDTLLRLKKKGQAEKVKIKDRIYWILSKPSQIEQMEKEVK